MRSKIIFHDVVYRGYFQHPRPVDYHDQRVVRSIHYTGVTSNIGGETLDQWAGYIRYYNSLPTVWAWVPTGSEPNEHTVWENDRG